MSAKGYEILERFHEEGESAKTTDRSELQVLLKYCRAHKGKVHCAWSRTGFSTVGSSGGPKRRTEPRNRSGGSRPFSRSSIGLDEAFLYSESIDLTSYSRQRDKLREELTFARRSTNHAETVDELDVQGILAFASWNQMAVWLRELEELRCRA